MHQSVRDAFMPFTTNFEGRVPFMYLDILGKVTTGIGNLIDSPGEAQRLPWTDTSTGTAADPGTIEAAWQAVKGRQDMRSRGGMAFESVTTLRLSDDDIDALVLAKVDSNESFLKSNHSEFAGFDDWPADAQLGLLSMAWAQGPSFAKWPSFRAAAAAGDWATAAAQCHLEDSHNPGLRPRNAADLELFNNAASVVESGSDPSVLVFSV
jgi:GH24 family phage-related lysozyme (muramidase)